MAKLIRTILRCVFVMLAIMESIVINFALVKVGQNVKTGCVNADLMAGEEGSAKDLDVQELMKKIVPDTVHAIVSHINVIVIQDMPE